MIHPHTAIQWVDDHIGYGVMATRSIPRGTVVYVLDALELVLSPGDGRLGSPLYRDIIDRYSYIQADGSRVLSWDAARLVNHSCAANSLSTGYGFEIAIRDIEAGEQLTDDYGLLNIEHAMRCACGAPRCRGLIAAREFDHLVAQWDRAVKPALSRFNDIEQPLLPWLDAGTLATLEQDLVRASFRSVSTLCCRELADVEPGARADSALPVPA